MTARPAPYTVPYDLGALSDRGEEFRLEPGARERAAIAEWLGATEVERLKATVRLSRRGDDHYRYEARFEADVVQACVVTLEAVPSHLASEFSRDLRLRPRAQTRKSAPPGSHEITNMDEDEPELLDGSVLDLAAPVLEELSLALDPYPRAPGAAFQSATEPDAEKRENPFAVLGQLKGGPDPSARAGNPLKGPRPNRTKSE